MGNDLTEQENKFLANCEERQKLTKINLSLYYIGCFLVPPTFLIVAFLNISSSEQTMLGIFAAIMSAIAFVTGIKFRTRELKLLKIINKLK